MIRRSGTSRRFAATSSSSGRTRFASTVGAYGPPWRTSQRVTSMRHAVGRGALARGLDGLRPRRRRRAPAPSRASPRRSPARRCRSPSRRARPPGSSARQQLERQPGRGVRAGAERLAGLDHDVQRAFARRLPRRADAQAGQRRSACGSCASPRPSRRASSVVETSTSAPPTAARTSPSSGSSPGGAVEHVLDRLAVDVALLEAAGGERHQLGEDELGVLARDADREPDHARAPARARPSRRARAARARRSRAAPRRRRTRGVRRRGRRRRCRRDRRPATRRARGGARAAGA